MVEKAHITITRELREAENKPITLNPNTVSFLALNTAIIHLIEENKSIYGLINIHPRIVEELFNNLIKLKPIHPPRIEELYSTQTYKLPPLITPSKPHQNTSLAIILTTTYDHELGVTLKAKIYAKTKTINKNRQYELNVIAQYGTIEQEPVKYSSLQETINDTKLTGSKIYTRKALLTLLKPQPKQTITTPLEINLNPIPQGKIPLGEILNPLLEPTHQIYKLPINHGHTLIIGATGTGKSTTLAKIAQETTKYNQVIILDWTGEHIKTFQENPQTQIITPGKTHTIPLKTGNETPLQVVEKIAYYIETTWNQPITPLQYRLLLTTITRIDNPTPTTIIIALKNMQTHNRRDIRQSADALISRLIPLTENQHLYTPIEKPPITLQEIKGNPTIINLSPITPTHIKTLTAQLILHTLLQQTKQTLKPIHILIDEAHNYIKQTQTTQPAIIQAYLEYRKYNVKITIATSNAIQIPKEITQNTNTLITHRIPNITQAKTITDYLITNPKQQHLYIETLRTLPTGTAIITSPQTPPTIIKINPPNTH